MNEDFVSEETARLAKKANFNEPCLFFYYNGKLHFHKLKRRLKMMYLKYTEFETICNSKLILKDNSVCAPTQAGIAKWLRDKHNIHVTPILSTCDKDGKGVYECEIIFPDKDGYALTIASHIYNVYAQSNIDKFDKNIGKYEEAMELGLKFALNTLINKNHYKDIEHKIGEIFKYDGKNIKVEKCNGRYDCGGCIHEKINGIYKGCCMHDEFEKFKDFEECVAEYRKDKENVKFTEFKENEKI